jgi:hypothetical protein
VCNSIVAVLRVPADIAIEPISHMQELLGNNHLERPRLRAIDAREIDQDQMFTGCRHERICATDRCPQSSSQPTFEDPPLGGDAKAVRWQREEPDVSFEKISRFLVVDQPTHDGDLRERRASTAARRAQAVVSCAGQDHHSASERPIG